MSGSGTAPALPALASSLAEVGASHARQGQWLAAASCLRSAISLGAPALEVELRLVQLYVTLGLFDLAAQTARDASMRPAADPGLSSIAARLAARAEGSSDARLSFGTNEYARWTSLSRSVATMAQGSPPSVLDVGGGSGGLHLFLPGSPYVLVEPTVNGMDGRKLPFAPKSFDVVVACHVLEHIQESDREKFLDTMASVARRSLILLNPFRNDRYNERSRLELIIKLTQAQWAKEHLECGLPERSDVARWATSRAYPCRFSPDGSVPLGMSLALLDHYAQAAGRAAELAEVRRYLNASFVPLPVGADDAGSWLVEVDLSTGSQR